MNTRLLAAALLATALAGPSQAIVEQGTVDIASRGGQVAAGHEVKATAGVGLPASAVKLTVAGETGTQGAAVQAEGAGQEAAERADAAGQTLGEELAAQTAGVQEALRDDQSGLAASAELGHVFAGSKKWKSAATTRAGAAVQAAQRLWRRSAAKVRSLKGAPIVEWKWKWKKSSSGSYSSRATVDWTTILTLLGLTGVTAALWHSAAVYPIDVLITFFHEMSHALGAVLTGGHVSQILIHAQEGALGSTYTSGGFRVVVVSAGYIGSVVWGGLLTLGALKTDWNKWISRGLSGVMLLTTVFLVRSLPGWGWGLSFAAAFFGLSLLPEKYIRPVLAFIGLNSMVYALVDMKAALVDRVIAGSDAEALSRVIPLPAQVWGGLWAFISVATILAVLWISARKKKASVWSS